MQEEDPGKDPGEDEKDPIEEGNSEEYPSEDKEKATEVGLRPTEENNLTKDLSAMKMRGEIW